jgi:hypothetical protein
MEGCVKESESQKQDRMEADVHYQRGIADERTRLVETVRKLARGALSAGEADVARVLENLAAAVETGAL